jgi:hypothetical protein
MWPLNWPYDRRPFEWAQPNWYRRQTRIASKPAHWDSVGGQKRWGASCSGLWGPALSRLCCTQFRGVRPGSVNKSVNAMATPHEPKRRAWAPPSSNQRLLVRDARRREKRAWQTMNRSRSRGNRVGVNCHWLSPLCCLSRPRTARRRQRRFDSFSILRLTDEFVDSRFVVPCSSRGRVSISIEEA